MATVLITGMSGTGRSTVLQVLAEFEAAHQADFDIQADESVSCELPIAG